MSSQQAQSKREMPIAEVVRLIELVNYQEGAVVSRTLVKRATGTVTLFAFDKGQGLSELRSTQWHIFWRAKRKLRFLASHHRRRQAKRSSCLQINLTR
jgi:hypothetical protein